MVFNQSTCNMNKITFITLLISSIYLSCFSTVYAQDISKEERDEWVALIKGREVQTTEGLLCMSSNNNGKVGCIDTSGATVVPFKYDFIKGFYNGLAAVNIGGEFDKNYLPYPPGIKGGKWGIIDKTGKEITSLKYDYIPAVEAMWFEDLIPVELNGKQGIINRKGQEITAIKYDNTEFFDDGLWLVSLLDSALSNNDPVGKPHEPEYFRYNKMGLVDESGEITPVKYSLIYSPFIENIIKVEIIDDWDSDLGYSPQKYGFINKKGEEILPPKYDEIDDFSEGLAMVRVYKRGKSSNHAQEKYKCGYIDNKARVSIPLKYSDATSFSNGMAKVAVVGDSAIIGVHDNKEWFQPILHWGLINTSGEVLVPLKYNKIGDFSRGMAIAELNGKVGFIDSTGKEVIPLKYDYIQESGFNSWLGNRFVSVKLNKKWGFIDSTGKEVIPVKFDEVGYFSEGFVKVKLNNKWKFFNEKGNELTSLKYDSAEEFHEGYSVVELNNKYGYIDKTGKVVIPIKYDYAYNFSNGKAKVKVYENKEDTFGETFYIDKTGKRIEK